MYQHQLQTIYQINDLHDLFLLILVTSTATQSLTFLLRKSVLFGFLRHKYSPIKFLLSCGYCFSFYVSFFILSPTISFSVISYVDLVFFLTIWLVVQRISNIIHDITKLIYFGRIQHINIMNNHGESVDEQQ
jgi:hypothetical protein